MKIIVSHDVDHLYGRDHWFRDLIYPKLCLRSLLLFLRKQITLRECGLRLLSCFSRRRNCIDELMRFDRANGVPSVFFFGMNQGLGMSYYPDEAKAMIKKVHDRGFDTGVHGIEYRDLKLINTEYRRFGRLMGFGPCGIRMHYVRFDENTFAFEEKCGYAFDSTEFDKEKGFTLKAPYKVGRMWEFPLTIMDGYLPQSYEAAKHRTLEILEQCRKSGVEYVSVLFHDNQFNNAYTDIRDWYIWLVNTINSSEKDTFISYGDAIRELEENNGR